MPSPDCRHRLQIFGRDFYKHMDVVRVHFCLNNFYLLPLTQLSQYFSYFFPLLSVKYFSPIFWGKYYVIFAIPTRMLLWPTVKENN